MVDLAALLVAEAGLARLLFAHGLRLEAERRHVPLELALLGQVEELDLRRLEEALAVDVALARIDPRLLLQLLQARAQLRQLGALLGIALEQLLARGVGRRRRCRLQRGGGASRGAAATLEPRGRRRALPLG